MKALCYSKNGDVSSILFLYRASTFSNHSNYIFLSSSKTLFDLNKILHHQAYIWYLRTVQNHWELRLKNIFHVTLFIYKPSSDLPGWSLICYTIAQKLIHYWSLGKLEANNTCTFIDRKTISALSFFFAETLTDITKNV